ncbi:MAG: 1-acyl-sn-glycerol-3-phosphate acyltransferase [Actinobacteria bacterium]|nr:1-acyl-sn-glycerol-3-phosphate acyltransferase [Actinomycetota bacterium]MDA8185764.1 lysophospholipid acyltransferase family protein [Actinomycetota bacterium]
MTANGQPALPGVARSGISAVLYRLLRQVAHMVNRTYWRVAAEGAESVPVDGPVILAPVHRSFIDFFLVSEVTRRPIAFMAKDNLWRSRLGGKVLEWLGAFPVNRSGPDRGALARAEAVLQSGGVLVVFPEGTRRSGPVVEDLHEGAVFLAARTGAPIVPIGIGGSEDAMPKGSKLLKPARIALVVGEPIRPPEVGDAKRVSRHQLRQGGEQLRAELQRLFDIAGRRAADYASSAPRAR